MTALSNHWNAQLSTDHMIHESELSMTHDLEYFTI